MITGNIDVSDARYNTNAPFTHDSQMKLNGISVPADVFRCIKIYCTEDNSLPCRISSVGVSRRQRDTVEVVFSDCNDVQIGTWWLHKPSAHQGYALTFICDDARALRGFVAASPEAYGLLYGAASTATDNSISVTDDFKLLPMCCVPYFRGSMRSISAAGRTTCDNVALYPSSYTRSSWNSQTREFAIGVVGKAKIANGVNGICKLTVTCRDGDGHEWSPPGMPENDSMWVGGVDLLLRHAPVSNIRLVTDNKGLSMKGVLDTDD